MGRTLLVVFVVLASIGLIAAVAGGERALPDRVRGTAWRVSVASLAAAGVALVAVAVWTLLDRAR